MMDSHVESKETVHLDGQSSENLDPIDDESSGNLKEVVSALTEAIDIKSEDSKYKSVKNFFIEETLAPTDIKVSVEGIGQLSFPLNKASVQKLIHVSGFAESETAEKTVVDKNVPNIQTIDSKNLNVTIHQEFWSRIIYNMQKAFGLPENCTLTPYLHNMLIYGPGQFSNDHRGSKKLQSMVATLVIVLPSPHIGGDLIIQHDKNEYTFSSESVDEENAKCIVFYFKCLHKVSNLKSGYRVALTYKIVLETGELADTACTNDNLKAALQHYFNTMIDKERANKIVFFLNHTYSQQSLGWHLLKGEDIQYASNFRSAAQELDLDVHLVLATIHQCWKTENINVAKPKWVVDTRTTLEFWIDANNEELSYGEYFPTSSEICFARKTNSANFKPTKQEFSGHMSEEGPTMEYWYKRAAVVMWQKTDLVLIKFELNFDVAITELTTLASVLGNEEKIKEMVNLAAELLHKRLRANNFETFAKIALYIKSNKDARSILSSFDLNVLISRNVQMLIQLQRQYGVDWLIELLDDFRREDHNGSSLMNSENIYPLVNEFLDCGGDKSFIESLLKKEITHFIEQCAKLNTFYHVGGPKDLERTRELILASVAIDNVKLQEKLIKYLTSQLNFFPKSEHWRASPEEVVKQELLLQTRPLNDWSIMTNLSCDCEHCKILLDFLRSKADIHKLWRPNRGNLHKHLTVILDRAKVPVDLTVLRGTKPPTIMLVKNASLHTDAANKCVELQMMLQTLELTTVKKGQPSAKKEKKKRQKS